MKYKITKRFRYIFWGDAAVAKNLTLVEERDNSVIKRWTFKRIIVCWSGTRSE